MVTRTITTTVANVLCLDIINAEPCNKTVTLPRTYKDEKKLMEAITRILAVDADTCAIEPVHVVDTRVEETLYGMTEDEFITHAHALPPRKASTKTNG